MSQPLKSQDASTRAARREASAQLIAAHQAEAVAEQRAEIRRRRIEQALERGAEQVTFYHRLDGDQDTTFDVYFFRDEVITVAALRLCEIDSRAPTPQEASVAECELQRLIDDGGEVWIDLLSQL